MSEAHDTEEEEKCELPETDEMGARNFFWSDNDKHSTTRCSKASKQGRRDIITMYMYVCIEILSAIVFHQLAIVFFICLCKTLVALLSI
jgi:hypothetical protein